MTEILKLPVTPRDCMIRAGLRGGAQSGGSGVWVFVGGVFLVSYEKKRGPKEPFFLFVLKTSSLLAVPSPFFHSRPQHNSEGLHPPVN